jgi:uncharacterized protein YbjT (DUF2867 family)
MADKKLITVIGATGAQGGGLVRAILDDPDGEFSVRAVTRDPSSDKAKALADLGAEVVAADVDDVESLKQVFDGAYGAYCVTFYWAHMSPEKEAKEARNMAVAAKEAGVEHVIWSTLEDTRQWVPLEDDRMPTLMEKYKVPHFDAKGASDHFFDEMNVPTTCLRTTFYWDNLIHFGMGPQKADNGSLTLALPLGDRKLAGIAAEDIGKCALGIFKRGSELIGKTVGIAGGHLTGEEMASALSDALGREVTYNAVPFDVYRSFDFPGADDLGNMFQFYHDFEEMFRDSRDLEFSRSVNPDLKSFSGWLAENKEQIPIG